MDYYDKAVEYLTEHPEQIICAWTNFDRHAAGKLFDMATPTRRNNFTWEDGPLCDCLTQIRSGGRAWTNELTVAIKADERLPRFGAHIRASHLPVFAEWQRRIDAELGRTPPAWTPPEPTP